MTDFFSGSISESLISTDMYIVIAAVYGICFALKKASFFDDRFIPLAAIVLGIGLQIIASAASGATVSDSVLKGIICGISAVFTENVRKQIGPEEEGDEVDDEYGA